MSHWAPKFWLAAFATVAVASIAQATPTEVTLPLHHGVLHTPDLVQPLCRELGCPEWDIPAGDIDLKTARGQLCLKALNAAMGDGCRIQIGDDSVVVHFDAERMPHSENQIKKAVRIFVAGVTPEASARQAAHWGLFPPPAYDPTRPLVILVHGLDSERADLYWVGSALDEAGYQVGYFAYPDDQPIEESGQYLSEQMASFFAQHPGSTVDIVAHSMGGLVARTYIEGPHYKGGVDRLIMVGTPNHGSKWASGRIVLEAVEQYRAWKSDPQWRWTWAVTDGLGEAGDDLLPKSRFLKKLNAEPRRAGVRYTIVAGCQSPTTRYSAELEDAAIGAVPPRAAALPGMRQCVAALRHYEDRSLHHAGDSDGPVPVSSAKLAGVKDVVILNADHETLIFPARGNPPAALAVIEDRLKQ